MRQRNNKTKAVEIAKDVLKWLSTKKIVPHPGTYWDLAETIPPGSVQTGLREVVTKSAPCHVCALGALFIAGVDRYNKLETSYDRQYFNAEEMRNHLDLAFTLRQLHLIEYAFEQWTNQDDPELTAAGLKYINIEDSTTRLREICKNIIDNEGVFTV